MSRDEKEIDVYGSKVTNTNILISTKEKLREMKNQYRDIKITYWVSEVIEKAIEAEHLKRKVMK